MPRIEIVLISPIYEGNVGFTARVMKNFGFEHLVLVDACPLGDEALARAAHAQDVLRNAVHCSLVDVIARSSMTVATTGEVAKSVCHTMRMPYYTPGEIRGMIGDVDGTVSVLFGRENWGLSNAEIRRSDVICTIPTSSAYPILNLSHAVGILCHELAQLPRGTYPLASRDEMEYLYRHIDQFLDRIEHPPYKRENTLLMMRRIFGRARLTVREASTLHGLMRRSEWHIDDKK
jgi:tRNA/rRNA methyltransferase